MGLNTANEILEARTFLRGKYTTRDGAYAKLRALYNADYFSGKSHIQGVKLVYNLLANVVDRYTDFMSQPPDWRVIPVDTTEEALIMADKQEKFLYSQWELNNIQMAQQWQAHLQALLGSFGFSVMPNFNDQGKIVNKEHIVRINVLTPDYTYAMPKSDNIRDLDFVIVDAYDYRLGKDQYNPTLPVSQKRDFANTHIYYDENVIKVIEKGEIKNEIGHEFGFLPIVLGQNRVKPHCVEGVGDLDQSVGLMEYTNELLSWLADMIEYHANPITIIKGYTADSKLPANGRWFLGPDGDAKFLQWQGPTPAVENMINRMVSFIQDQTHLSPAILGNDIPSGTSGSAVQTLLSGIQATMLRKQVTLGDVYNKTNEVIFKIVEKIFSNKEIVIRGTRRGNVFVERFQGSEINGNYRNQVVWPPGILDQSSRIGLEIQKLSSGLQSRYTTMEKIGIDSPIDEMKRIEAEEMRALEKEMMRNGGNNPLGQDFKSMASNLSKSQVLQPQGSGGGLVTLQQAIRDIPKLKGDALYGGKDGQTFVVVLTEMSDKATIVNRLPPELKGKIKFRKFDEQSDANLPVIVEQQGVSANAAPGR